MASSSDSDRDYSAGISTTVTATKTDDFDFDFAAALAQVGAATELATPSTSTAISKPVGTGTKGKGKGRAKDTAAAAADAEAAEEARKRSTKACDNCRKSKCKCTRILDPATQDPVGPCENCLTVGSECTFNGTSRKRGPPKGYIEAIESRLHRMEVLLGGLLGSDDPRAQTLLGELIGDTEARDILARDLKAAASVPDPKDAKRSWKREYIEQQQQQASTSEEKKSTSSQAVIPAADAFPTLPGQPAFVAGPGPLAQQHRPPSGSSTWLTEEDLLIPASSTDSFDASGFTICTPSALTQQQQQQSYRKVPNSGDSSDGTSPSIGSIPIARSPLMPQGAAGGGEGAALSPRQRRRLDGPAGLSPDGRGSMSPPAATDERKQMAYAFRLPPIGAPAPRSGSSSAAAAAAGMSVLAPDRVGHTGTSTYKLSTGEVVSAQEHAARERGGTAATAATTAATSNSNGIDGAEVGEAATNEPLTELADVVGQLSLNENAEVRYHGRSSGLYLISKSQRYRDFFWHFPSSTYWPPLEGLQRKTEREILGLKEGEDPLPDLETQSHLLMAYWTYVHPHFPVCYKVAFLRQYRHSLAHPDSTEPSTPAGTGKVPTVLLLCMFALAARYCDIDKTKTEDGKLWPAGQEYLDKARALLNYDYGSSKLVTVQALLLISYREVGVGAMSSAWMTAGMAIRMAQDLGLFRDVEKWFVPIQRFSHEEKQTRKRVWWACVILDRYTASYIGRPGTIHERDYDCGFPSEDEPDEHEQWRPVRVDGTEFSGAPKSGSAEALPAENVQFLKSYPPKRAHTLSCFNAAAALAVIINRIISNIYAIRIRVLGQSSETLLSLLDQSLASWFLALPPHLQYNPAGKSVPPPHILSLHLQFYNSLILLHRPFIPGQNSKAGHGTFPSHSICTTAANAIANIVTIWRKTWSLRQCPPFLTYPIFSAGIICVYNASFDESLAHPAKVHLLQCMEALHEMELIWGSATRQRELLHGLVDLRDAELTSELGLDGQSSMAADEAARRGRKRAGMDVDDTSSSGFGGGSGKSSSASPAPGGGVRTNATFHQKPMGQRQPRQSGQSRRRSSSSSQTRPNTLQPLAPKPPAPTGSSFPASLVRSPPIPEETSTLLVAPPFGAGPPPVGTSQQIDFPTQQAASATMGQFPIGNEAGAQSFDILNPDLDLSQFKSPPGTSSGGTTTNYTDLLNAFFPGADGSSWGTGGNPFAFGQSAMSPASDPTAASTMTAAGPGGPTSPSVDPTPAFFGMPLGANLGDEWLSYSYNAFPGMSDAMVGASPGENTTAMGTITAASPPLQQQQQQQTGHMSSPSGPGPAPAA
ncbi:hypothetical protein JCM10908_002295 [Rhodotorula pacifica]|uniref:uncharacterized protein n=1 Tax=Rhodotorula pacifica TaxID=1495444 RepID=UPI00317693A0